MLFNNMRFNACALRVLDEKDELFIGEYYSSCGGMAIRHDFRDYYLIVSFLLLSSLIGSGPLCIVAYDGRGVGHSNRCMRHGLAS